MKITTAVAQKQGANLTIESAELDSPKANEVLVEIKATGICHTDAAGRDYATTPYPVALGLQPVAFTLTNSMLVVVILTVLIVFIVKVVKIFPHFLDNHHFPLIRLLMNMVLLKCQAMSILVCLVHWDVDFKLELERF